MKNKISKIKGSVKNPIKKLSHKDESELTSSKVPYITNETVAEHREEVLSGARKYIYPLQHSKHKIVWLSIVIFFVTLIAFLTYSILSLYKFQNTSTFTYRVTQIVPFPIARVEGSFISYESYLFELRRNVHYYKSQQKINFDTEEGKELLGELKKQALDQVINDAYVKNLANKNDVSISSSDLEKEIDLMIKQDRLGTDDKMLEDVLRDYWGWSINDFKRSFKQQLLARKVASKLDNDAHEKANKALNELNSGKDFSEVVKEYSDDESTKENGGDYGVDITLSYRDISAKVAEVIFAQEAGKISNIIEADNSLEIVKTLSVDGHKAKAAHVQFSLKPINDYIEEAKKASQPKIFVGI